jgi:arginase
MGAGPLALLDTGVAQEVNATVDVVELTPGSWPGEVQSAIQLSRHVAARVRAARERGAFPLVLSGNCWPAAVGCVAALPADTVYWFDAHADFNTPDTTPSGYADGTTLAAICGHCWKHVLTSVEGFAPLPESSVVLLGVRDVDPGEAAAIDRGILTHIGVSNLQESLEKELSRRSNAATYVHLDLDVLDPADGKVNLYSAPGGLSVSQLESALGAIIEKSPVQAIAFTAFDPSADPERRILRAGKRLITRIAEMV